MTPSVRNSSAEINITSRSDRKVQNFQESNSSQFATPPKRTSNVQNSTVKRKRHDDEDGKDKSASSHKKQKQNEEKRLKMFRKKAPQSFLEKLSRAQSQRMIVVGRERLGEGPDLREEIDIVGSTGNIYKVTIGRLPECTCPDHRKGNECKHKVYALHKVLKAPENLEYQRAFLTNELHEIFDNAPPIPTANGEQEDKDGKRKPIEGECPICYMDFEPDKNDIVWCQAGCGNNMHKSCFEQWVASQRGQVVRCVYCRTEWQADNADLAELHKAGNVGEDGYVNVAEQFGIPRARDYSSYHQPWARRQFGYGW